MQPPAVPQADARGQVPPSDPKRSPTASSARLVGLGLRSRSPPATPGNGRRSPPTGSRRRSASASRQGTLDAVMSCSTGVTLPQRKNLALLAQADLYIFGKTALPKDFLGSKWFKNMLAAQVCNACGQCAGPSPTLNPKSLLVWVTAEFKRWAGMKLWGGGGANLEYERMQPHATVSH